MVETGVWPEPCKGLLQTQEHGLGLLVTQQAPLVWRGTCAEDIASVPTMKSAFLPPHYSVH
jgi:hypothetical protein